MTMSFFKKPIFWLLVFAFSLRIIGVFEGLPAVYNSTEHFLAKFTLKMAAEKTLDPGFYIYPSLYQYILALLYGLYFVLGLLIGLFKDSYDFAVQFLIDPTCFYVISRSVSTIISVLSIWLLYKFVVNFRDEKNAFIAAVIMSLSYYSIHFSRLAIQESFLILFTILAMSYFWKSQNRAEKKFLFWAGVFCGLAIASKYNAGFLIFGLFLSVYFSWKKFSDELGIRILLATIGILSGFLITNPYWIYAPQKYINGFILVTEQMYYGISLERGINYLWELKEIVIHEWILGIIFLVSVIYAIMKKNPFYLTLLSVTIPTIIYVGSWPKKGIDYLIVCWPIFFFFSALLLMDILEKYTSNQRIRGFLLSVIFIPSILYTGHQTILSILPDTRQLTSDWILDNIKADDKICYDKNGYDLQIIDVRRFTDYGTSAESLPKDIKSRLLSIKNISRNVNFVPGIKIIDNNSSKKRPSVQWKTLDDLIAEGVTYFISNQDFRQMFIRSGESNNELVEGIKQLYLELESRLHPIEVFESNLWRKGPRLKIYNLIDLNK
ncbi:ArnT family glycosyltransferase [Calditrichota bacterium]